MPRTRFSVVGQLSMMRCTRTTGSKSRIKPMTTSETWVRISMRAAPILIKEVSLMPMTFITIRKKTMPMAAKVPTKGEALKGSQKKPRYGGMVKAEMEMVTM